MSIVEKNVTLRQQDNAGEYDKLYVATTATQTKFTASTAALFDGDVKNADDAGVDCPSTARKLYEDFYHLK